MPANDARTARRQGRRPEPPDREPQRRVAGRVVWGGPSRRARILAALLAIALAMVTFAVVNGEWRRAAPPPAPAPTSVELRLIATPAAVPPPAAH